MAPLDCTARDIGVSFLKARCVRAPLYVLQVRKQNVAQMALAKDHDVIKAFASDRPDQAFAMSILPRRAWGGWLVSNAHGAETSFEDVAIGCVCRKLNPAVLVMESAEEGVRFDVSNPLNGARDRRVFV